MQQILRALQERVQALGKPGLEAIRQLPKDERRERYGFANFEGLAKWRKGARLFGPLQQAAKQLGCTIRVGKPYNTMAAADCDTATRDILIRRFKGRRAFQAYALAHELAHCVLQHGVGEPPPVVGWQTERYLGEIEAETVAHLVCAQLGLDTLEVASRYVLNFQFKLADEVVWSPEREARILAAAETIHRVVRNR